MVAKKSAILALLNRLAILETQPILTPDDLIEWYQLRKWVLGNDDLLKIYRDLPRWKKANEITKVQKRPKKPNMFIRLYRRLFPKK